MFVLDTDHIGILQRRTEPEFNFLSSRMRNYDASDFFVAIVSFQEQISGWNLYLNRARDIAGYVKGYRMMQDVLSDFLEMNILPFDTTVAETFFAFRRAGIRVGTMDLRIGSIALVHGFTVLTRNTVDFEKIPGLNVEDSTTPIQ